MLGLFGKSSNKIITNNNTFSKVKLKQLGYLSSVISIRNPLLLAKWTDEPFVF